MEDLTVFYLWINFIVYAAATLVVSVVATAGKVAFIVTNPFHVLLLNVFIFIMAIRSTYLLGREMGRRSANAAPLGWFAGAPFWQAIQGVSAVVGIASFLIQVFPMKS